MRIHLTKAQAVALRDVAMAYSLQVRRGEQSDLGSRPFLLERAASRIHAAVLQLPPSHLPVGPYDERDQT